MRKLNFIIFISIFLISCKSDIIVDEFCSVKSIIEGEYGTYSQVLYLAEDNDTTNMELDTMYFKVDKQTKNIFKLKDQEEYEANRGHANFDIEKYVYLKPSNHHEDAWHSTLILYSIPKYTDRIKCMCKKDVNAKLVELIKKQLNNRGYQTGSQEVLKFEGELKDAVIKYQKENKLPYGNLDIKTLRSLGIKIKEK